VIAKGTRIAAHLLEASEADIEFKTGKFVVAGTDKSVPFSQIAASAYAPAKLPKGLEPGLYESGTYDGGQMTFPNGCHVCEVEIDEETGKIDIVRYVAVDDVGHIINPLLVEGQLHGGIVQGLGEALMEQMVYDESGQVVTGSFMDYGMPRAHQFIPFELGENEVPTKTNPLGVKGAGESGTVGALPACMNAIQDALASAGASHVPMPVTAAKVWTALEEARRKQAAMV
jgi:aerobic carbon-monoxide dehydrogenase large subunit